jgi:hypothetical protein
LVALVMMAIVALPFMRNRTQISAIDRVYLSLCQKLADHGVSRADHEGPFTLMQRLKEIKGKLPEAQYLAFEEFLSLYSASKYGPNTTSDANIVARLKTLLAEYRRRN